jgi:2-polyprenyl-3-methyl-5-hydroxy-6-metoxy-1,4-benzoquinol methylase
MNELKELFEKGRWYHCFRHESLTSNGTYDVGQYLDYYKFDDDYKGKTVLDVGCSDGYFSIWMKEHGADRVCGVDSNKYDGSLAFVPSHTLKQAHEAKYIQYADDYARFHSVYEQYGLNNPNKFLLMAKLKKLEVDYQTGTIYNLKPHGEFDVVMCNDLLEHLRDPITAIEELYFVTKEKCIITVSSAMKTGWFERNNPVARYQGHISGGSFYSLSEAIVKAMCQSAGFKQAEVVSRFEMVNRVHSAKNRHFVVHAHK